jgi:hypothetical protein
MDIKPSKDSLILVVVLNNLRDFEIARLLGWYRIPLRSAPKMIDVDFLAFYQTAAFEDDKWRIRYISEVRGHELTTRAELIRDEPDHPHSHQEYYKIQIGSLVELPRPIQAGEWRRITFFYTTGEYLLNAETVNDLVVHPDDRRMLWHSLRERALQRQEYKADDLPDFDMDPELIYTLLGFVDRKP